MKKNRKNSKHKISLLTILEICILLSVSSYAWFSDKSSPSINQNNIKVTSSEGLVIKLTPDSDGRTEVDLNEIIGDMDNFELKQMSTTDTTDYYTIDFGEGLTTSNPKFILIPKEDNDHYNSDKWGIIDFDFFLQTEDLAKHIYLHKDTSFTGIASNAIRMAITYSIDGISETLIFGDIKEDGKEFPYTTKAIVKTGEFIYNDIDDTFTDNQNVRLVSEKNGGRQNSDDDPIDLTKVLLTLDANSMTKLNIKVWLEGGDVDCDNTLASTFIDMIVKFGSANVLLDAPNLVANNTLQTITGLTTEMEYAFTNDNATIWTSVVDSNMKFDRGTTVYVRIKEVPGVSPSSYVKAVVFN